jgi:hypothetical protein
MGVSPLVARTPAAPAAPQPATALQPAAGAAVSSMPPPDLSHTDVDPSAWRLKFLTRVGIPPDRSEGEGRSRSSSEAAAAAMVGPRIRTPVPSSTDLAAMACSSNGEPEVPAVVLVKQVPVPRRSVDDIRGAYIKKLEMSRATIPQLNRPKQSQTVTS